MLRKFVFSVFILGTLLVSISVFAQEEMAPTDEISNEDEANILLDSSQKEITSIGEVSDPGILPDSPLYFLKTWKRNIQLFFAFTPEKKAELELKFANEDVLVIQKLTEKGKYNIAEKLSEKYQKRIQKATEKLEQAKKRGKDVEALTEKLKENHLRQQDVLTRVLDKAPEQAKDGLLNAIENSGKGLENAIEKIQGKEKLEQFRERLNLQIENAGEDTQLQIRERLELKERQNQIENKGKEILEQIRSKTKNGQE